MKSTLSFLSLILVATMAPAQQAPDGLQFNVPYLCSDGQTYLVHRCATGPKGEFCYYQAEGQSERYNIRASVAYQMTKYAAPGGLKIEFRDDSATLACGEVTHSEAYSVVPEGGQLVAKFDNNTGPFVLTLQPDGSLTGPASVDVAGSHAVRSGSGEITYQPRNAHCSVGTLTANK